MHILVHVIRHVIIDNVGHIGDVQPSCSHSSRHQDWFITSAEVKQGFLPLSLKPEDEAMRQYLILEGAVDIYPVKIRQCQMGKPLHSGIAIQHAIVTCLHGYW